MSVTPDDWSENASAAQQGSVDAAVPGDDARSQGAAASVKSAGRVLSLFEYFAKTRTSRSLSEISSDLGYPVSSTLALLRSIQGMGYLNYDQQTKTYAPSIRFALLGQWIHDRLFERGAIIQLVEHLAAITRETVSLGIQSGLQSQHVHIVQTSQSLSYNPAVGTLRPLLRSAVGKVLLAQQPVEAVLKIVARINALGVDERRTFDPQAFLGELDRVRHDGYAYSANVFERGAAIIAVALPAHAADVPMAVAVSGPSTRIDEQAVPGILKKIAGSVGEFFPKAIDQAPRRRTRRSAAG